MIVHQLRGPPPVELAEALTVFETQFTYPLGPGRSFRISHGDDYPRFFRAIGEAACFVAERQGRVLGTLGAAVRPLVLPDGSERGVVYLGDLKIAPSARGGRTLPRLARAAQDWVGNRADAAFAVVMDGTSATPERYTGRLGIAAFREVGKILVLRLLTATERADADERFPAAPAPAVEACYRRLSLGRYAGRGGNPVERSEMGPIWLMHPDGSACGRLEDTRRAKRLIEDDGTEMRAAHLSAFAYANVQTGAELIREALRRAAALAFPALFVAVPALEAESMRRTLEGIDIVLAPATVFAAGLQPFSFWHLNTAEI
jgi:hypothetical protein